MNKVFKVIWNEARNAYVVVSEIAKNHGSKSCSTKKLLAMLIATGVMTCASFDVLAAEPSGTDTAKYQYVAFADPTHTLYSGNKTTIDGHEYIYDATNKYWLRKGYKLVVEENGTMHTPLSNHGKSSDVAYIGNGDKDSILQSVASMVSASGTVTNMGESLNKITASGFVGVSHSGGTAVDGTWHYIIHDPTWEGAVAQGNYEDGYVDLVGKNMPKGFVTADDNKGLIWDDDKQAYNYKGKPVDYSNVYVIDGKIGVFTNKDGSDFYEGTVFGKNNEILMTVKDDNGHFYSYWASAVTDPSATMSTYRLAEYKKDLSVLVENDEKLSRNDIKEVTLDTTQANSATIGLLRNGDTEAGAPVTVAITVTSGGGTEGSDTFVKISNGTANQTFATGSKVEVNGPADAITGIKVNGVDYTIKQGSGVKVEQDAANKTTTITVDGNATTITDTHNALDSAKLDGKKLTITGKDKDSVEVDLSSIDTDTKYTAGNGITIDEANKNAISVKLKKGENNLEVTEAGLALKKDLTVDSVKAGDTTVNTDGLTIGTGIVLNKTNVSMGGQQIHNVAEGTEDTDAVNFGQLKNVSNNLVNVDFTNISNNGKTEIVNIAKAADVHVKDGQYSVQTDGTVTMKYVDGNGHEVTGNELKITDVASATKLNALNNTVTNIDSRVTTNSTNITTLQGEVITSGSIGANGKVELTKDNGSKVEVGTVKDYSVTSGTYDQTTKKLTLTKTDAYGNATLGTVDIDLSGIQSGDKNWTAQANGTDVKPNADNKVNFINGDNTNVTTSGDGVIAVNLSTALTGIQSITGVGGTINLAGSAITINETTFNKDGRIQNVAAGTETKDAVNFGQLDATNKKVDNLTTEVGKGWTVATDNGTATKVGAGDTVKFSGADNNIKLSNDGTNVKVELNKELKGLTSVTTKNAYVTEVNEGDKTSVTNVKFVEDKIAGVTLTEGNGISITDKKINVKLKDGEKNLVVDSNGLSLNTALTGIQSITGVGTGAGSISFADGAIKLNNKVTIDNTGKITGVAAGTADTDAVNVSQLKKVSDTANAGWNLSTNGGEASKVAPGETVDFSGDKNISVSNDGTAVSVKLNKNLKDIETISNGGATLTLGAMGGMVSEFTNGQGASVKLFGDTTTINGKVNVYKDGRIAGVADGVNATDAVNVSQLQKVSDTANAGWNLSTNGVATEATNVKPGETVDFSGDKNISVSHDGTKVKVELNKDLDVNSVQTNALNSKYNLSVGTMAENGIMPFFVNSTGAFYAASNKFSVDKDGNMNANSVQTNALNSKYNLSVGTANENGTVPFFVNSNGAFYAANGKLVVDKDGKLVAPEAELGKVTADEGVIGNVVLKDGVFYKHTALRDGELFVGDASGNYSQITTKGAKLGKVTIAEDGKISGVAAGEVSSTSTDAINGSQLHQTNENVAALDKRVTQNEADIATNKANIAQNAADIAANKANIAQNAADIATNKANIAQNKADIAQNKADIAQNKTDIKNLDNRVTNVEELAKKHTTVTAGDNITVTEDTNKDGGKEYKVALDKEIKLDSVTTGQTVMNNDGLKVGDKVSVTKDAVTAGKTSISDEGVKVGDKTYISDKGLNANDQKVTNVAAGEISATSKDAVNGSQLYKTNQEVVNNTNRINQLGSRVNKVGAGAAALAALHPMDFDPDDKLTFSAGYGNYGGENAAAIGAYYRPDEKVMFSVGGTVGNGENMVNAGVSFSLDRTNHVSNSRTAMAREILDLRAEVTELKAMVAKGGLASIAEDKMKIFPDVAENHWAYEYVGKLAAAGIIEGYPDGKFSGDRMMSRYEFAAMLYRAMQKGAQLDSKIINEFAPEMGRIRVDRISGEDGDRDKIERVRVNAVKGERDHYGNKIAKAEAKAK